MNGSMNSTLDYTQQPIANAKDPLKVLKTLVIKGLHPCIL